MVCLLERVNPTRLGTFIFRAQILAGAFTCYHYINIYCLAELLRACAQPDSVAAVECNAITFEHCI